MIFLYSKCGGLCAVGSPILHEYLHKITSETHPTPNCPLCNAQPHDTQHIFGCPEALWSDPGGRGGAAGPLVGSAGVGPGTGMRGGGGACRSPSGSTTTYDFNKFQTLSVRQISPKNILPI